MPKPLDDILSPEVLNRAWKSLSTDHAVWDAGIPRAEMERNLLFHLLTLRDDVAAGRYRPAPLRRFAVAKADGKQRVLSALCLRDKLLQKAVQLVLEPRAEQLFHHDSYGYRPRRNVEMALERTRERIRCGLHWLVDADIKGFFDNIPLKPLRRTVRDFVADARLMALIDQWLDVGAAHTSFLATHRGIPQGAILSPLFCNLYLHAFDSALDAAKIPFVRYADDFLLFTTDQADAERALDFARQKLEALDLQLNAEKTRVVQSSPAVIFLGQQLPHPSQPRPTQSLQSHRARLQSRPSRQPRNGQNTAQKHSARPRNES